MNIAKEVKQIIEHNKERKEYVWDLQTYPEMIAFVKNPTPEQISIALIAKLER